MKRKKPTYGLKWQIAQAKRNLREWPAWLKEATCLDRKRTGDGK